MRPAATPHDARRTTRRMVAPALALALALGASLAGPASQADRRIDPGRDIDGTGHQLKPADAAELAAALGVRASGARSAGARMAQLAQRTVTPSPASGPDFEMPFLCGTTWTGSTRASHSPSRNAVDFNAPDDYRKPVVASAAGTVTLVRSLTYSYGRYVVVDHGGGWSTLYAHLDSLAVSVGQRLDQGDLVGQLGTSGGSTGPHLHFEQRLNGAYAAPYFSRTTWRMGATGRSVNCGDRPVAGDWNGDGADEPGVVKTRSTSMLFRSQKGNPASDVVWGRTGDRAAVGDFDGDRVSQVGVKGLLSSTWSLRSASGAAATVTGAGAPTDVPLVGDWDGNGRAELGWYTPATRTFSLRWPDGSVRTVVAGGSGQVPVVGDWNGDRTTDVGTFEPTTATWRLWVGTTPAATLVHGTSGDLPVVGDWDGDRVDDLGTWRPSTARWNLRPSSGAARTSLTKFGLARG